MQHLRAIAALHVVLLLVAPVASVAQESRAEQEVRAFLVEFDKAVASRDLAFLERVLPNDYVMTGTSGRKSTRTQYLAFFKEERDTPTYRMVSLKHENVVVHAVGTMALVTNDYAGQTLPVGAKDLEPESFSGRHTAVLEKRNGRWMVIAEQDTEHMHDPDVMDRQVTEAARAHHALVQRLRDGRSYAELESSGEIAALTRVLAKDYTNTDEDGTVTNKAQTLEQLKKTPIRLTSAEVSDLKVFAIDNNAATERGLVRYVGTNAGTPFDVTARYTTTWVSWANGWQIFAQQWTVVKK